METRRTKADWDEIIEKYDMSGQTQSEFSRKNGVNVKSLGNQLRKRKVQNPIVNRSAEEWRVLIEAQKISGMNRAAWCKEHGINSNAMNSAEKRSNVKLQKSPEPKWLELSPVKNPGPEALKNEEGWCIKIRGSGIEVEISSNYPIDKLTSLIERLVKQ